MAGVMHTPDGSSAYERLVRRIHHLRACTQWATDVLRAASRPHFYAWRAGSPKADPGVQYARDRLTEWQDELEELEARARRLEAPHVAA